MRQAGLSPRLGRVSDDWWEMMKLAEYTRCGSRMFRIVLVLRSLFGSGCWHDMVLLSGRFESLTDLESDTLQHDVVVPLRLQLAAGIPEVRSA